MLRLYFGRLPTDLTRLPAGLPRLSRLSRLPAGLTRLFRLFRLPADLTCLPCLPRLPPRLSRYRPQGNGA